MLFLLALIGPSVAAIVTAKGRWKLYNLGIILGSIFAGLAIGVGAAAWGRNMASGAFFAVPVAIILGIIAAVGCWICNALRAKSTEATAA